MSRGLTEKICVRDALLKRGVVDLVRSVAFGADYDTFFIVFTDGTFWCHGDAIPNELDSKVASLRDGCGVREVALGPRGEWYIATDQEGKNIRNLPTGEISGEFYRVSEIFLTPFKTTV